MTAAPPLLQARDLHHRYRLGILGRRAEAPALDGVDLVVAPGEVLGIVGESGSGKTTLLRCALGLVPPESGVVEVLGQEWARLSRPRREALRRRVQPLFQDAAAHLDPALPLRALLHESARIHQPGEPPAPLVAEALAAVGLAHRADALSHELSGGERRRAGIARLLLCRPALVLADEPTAGLDAARKVPILRLLRSLTAGEDRGLVVVSHDLAVLVEICTRIVVMVAGRVVEELPVASLGRQPHHPHTTALLRACGLLPDGALLPPVGSGPHPGCPLARTCPETHTACTTTRPPLAPLPGGAPGHRVACHARTDPGRDR